MLSISDRSALMRVWALWLIAVVPFVLGWLAGAMVRACKIGWAAAQEGFQRGAKL